MPASFFPATIASMTDDRDAYLRQSRALRQLANLDEEAATVEAPAPEESAAPATSLSTERFAELQSKEEFVLTVAHTGLGKNPPAATPAAVVTSLNFPFPRLR